jgi:D-sedoheptulose 7-phosphate isomerase
MELNKMTLVNQVESRIMDSRALFNNVETYDARKLVNLAEDIRKIFSSKKRLAFVGNGGSAAEAMHLAAEFTGKCVLDHAPLPAICLNESQSAITAIANDYGIKHVFSRQVQAHLSEGDILIALSTSGKSENILNALDVANSMKVRSVLWMGNFPYENAQSEVWKVPSKSTPRIQEVHLSWGHILAEVVELILTEEVNHEK